MPVTVDALKAALQEAELLLRIDTYSTDKFLFITPKMYKQLKDDMKRAAEVAESGTADPIKVHMANKDLVFAIQGARTDTRRLKRDSIVITYLEELLLAVSVKSKITDELKNEKPLDEEAMRDVLRSVREELSEDVRAYTISGSSLTRESVAKFLNKLEALGVQIQDSEKQKLGQYEQRPPSGRHATRF